MEGLNKLKEGWLSTPMLAGMAVDGQTSASVTETGEKVFRIISSHTPSWYAFIAEKLVIPNALFFQWLIVLAEIGLGIAFISGTFTFLAGLGALALNINFLLSTGLYETSWWFIRLQFVCSPVREGPLEWIIILILFVLLHKYSNIQTTKLKTKYIIWKQNMIL